MSSGRTVTLNTGHAMPKVGYGTWQAEPGEVGDGVYEALRTGYRHLDLAKIYGNQPEVARGLRRALADVPGLRREHLFVTSKLWNSKHRPADVEAALDDTLAELGLDYLDVRRRRPSLASLPSSPPFPRPVLRLTAASSTSSTGPWPSSPATIPSPGPPTAASTSTSASPSARPGKVPLHPPFPRGAPS